MHTMTEFISLVDEQDNIIGKGERLATHQENRLHRAFSIFVFNNEGNLIIHRRALEKYHCGGLWTNTCCGHPRFGEDLNDAAHRRLFEEMGFDCPLQELFIFRYQTTFANGLHENEIDHVFVGKYSDAMRPDPNEVSEISIVSLDEIQKDVADSEHHYTYWFANILKDPQLFEKLQKYAMSNH